MFAVRAICWDPWNSREISTQMLEDGHPCLEIGQNYRFLSEPTKKILELVKKGKLHHGGHPVLRWHAGCATTIDDKRDNIMFAKPNRNTSANRIDGMSGLANAMTRAIQEGPKPKPYVGVRSVGA
jgi:phage terminase large subunit-like protein